MEVVEDESIPTASTSPSKLYGKPLRNRRMDHHSTLETTRSSMMMMNMNVTTMGSDLSVETHPSSTRTTGTIPFSERISASHSDSRDSRHDSPKEQEDDAMMTSEDPIQSNGNGGAFVLPPRKSENSNLQVPLAPSSLRTLPSSLRTRVITGGSRANSHESNSSNSNGNISSSSSTTTFVREEKVSLAPRFGRLEHESVNGGSLIGREEPLLAERPEELSSRALDRQSHLQELDTNSSLFSISGSMSSEFLEHQHQHHPDHQEEYLRYPTRIGAAMNSPTSTTGRDFMRELQCPSLPGHESEERVASTRIHYGEIVPAVPLQYRYQGHMNHQRPPFHNATTPSSNLSLALTKHSSALLGEHIQSTPQIQIPSASSPSPTNTIPGIGGSFCDNSIGSASGRDKPVISRCFAWSQDSQDDRRITKRARTLQEQQREQADVDNDGSFPVFTNEVQLTLPSQLQMPSSFLASVKQGQLQVQIIPTAIQHPSNSDVESSPMAPTLPTKVHWEEKVEHSNELMSHTGAHHQVLFGATDRNSQHQSHSQHQHEDVAMGDDEDESESNLPTPGVSNRKSDAISNLNVVDLPCIATANSASHYSFESN